MENHFLTKTNPEGHSSGIIYHKAAQFLHQTITNIILKKLIGIQNILPLANDSSGLLAFSVVVELSEGSWPNCNKNYDLKSLFSYFFSFDPTLCNYHKLLIVVTLPGLGFEPVSL